MPRIAVFVDVQNIYYTVKESFDCHFNYRELWRQLSLEGEIVLANAYAIDRNDSQQRKFQQALRNIGFTIKLKPYIQRSDGSAKGDWDVGITIDIMDAVSSASERVDRVVLLSGDGDFDMLLRRIGQSGEIETLVYGASALTAQSLIDATKQFRAIEGPLLLI
ncbi:MAG: uncharacterized LabA/DUF88 family protein [Flavobacteriaceae bacterium]|jgi:uncharacterized LabA/DUF88 family protein